MRDAPDVGADGVLEPAADADASQPAKSKSQRRREKRRGKSKGGEGGNDAPAAKPGILSRLQLPGADTGRVVTFSPPVQEKPRSKAEKRAEKPSLKSTVVKTEQEQPHIKSDTGAQKPSIASRISWP